MRSRTACPTFLFSDDLKLAQGRLKTFNLPFYLIRDFQTTTPSRSNNAR
ncbi:hypothetical protein RSJ68_11405 [Neisseria sp. DTU_2020_1000833_1_SI_GRL_NUU_006]|nr:hypothetical protein RSJ68_11405 [Neisseria sp. DTU_2020_1000833_1_SI_GRL_NUU_006]